MHIGQLGTFIWPVVVIAGLVVIGAVFSRRAGAASGRIWAGIVIVIVLQLLGPLWVLIIPSLFDSAVSFGLVSSIYGIVTSLATLAAIAVLASAATVGRAQGAGYLDPSRPGAPPSTYPSGGYQGTGYPPAGGQRGEQRPSGPGTNPYV